MARREPDKRRNESGKDADAESEASTKLLKNVSNTEPDFTIIYGQKQRRVHKQILRLHSDVFERMLDSPFQEAAKSELNMTVDLSAAVDTMIHYMYNFSYTIPKPHQAKPLSFLIHVIILADEWNVKALRKYAVSHLGRLLMAGSRSVVDFVDALKLAYSAEPATPDVRRKMIACAVNKSLLAGHDPKPLINIVNAALAAAPKMGFDLIQAYAEDSCNKDRPRDLSVNYDYWLC